MPLSLKSILVVTARNLVHTRPSGRVQKDLLSVERLTFHRAFLEKNDDIRVNRTHSLKYLPT